MINLRMTFERAFGFAAYAASLTLITTLSIWCAIQVGGAAMSMIDTAIIDGSGQPVSDRESRRLTALAVSAGALGNAEGLVAPVEARPAATPETVRVQVQPASGRRAPTESSEADPAAKFHDGDEDTYRTFCVRLCDGYFWPVSFSTTSDRFARNQVTCTSSCNSPAKLFVHKMPGGNTGTMTTLDGLPYMALKTAFLFRTHYDDQCKCQAQPWEQQALDRHRLHAATEAARKGNRVAATTVRDLTAKVDADRSQETKALLIATERANRDLAALAKTGTRAVASTQSEKRRKGDGARNSRVAEVQRDGVMRLGAVPAQAARSSWVPASGTSRNWKEKVFGGN